jgi:SAM-dependent methyltransferase
MKDDPTRNYYETHADEYFHATYAVDLQPLWEKLSKRLEKGDYILDLGSGSGRDLRYFAERGFRVIGIDYSASGDHGEEVDSRRLDALPMGRPTSPPTMTYPRSLLHARWLFLRANFAELYKSEVQRQRTHHPSPAKVSR